MQNISTKIEWNEQNKIRVRESDESQVKHLIVKALLMLHIKIKHRPESNWIKLYSEFPVAKERICDIYYENVRTKEEIAYEIQKDISDTWIKQTQEAYRDWEVYGMNKSDLIIIDLNKLSDDIETLSSEIRRLVI